MDYGLNLILTLVQAIHNICLTPTNDNQGKHESSGGRSDYADLGDWI